MKTLEKILLAGVLGSSVLFANDSLGQNTGNQIKDKNAGENEIVGRIEGISKACKISDEAARYAFTKTKPGITEKELQKAINDFIKSKGYGLAFPTISVAGNNTNQIHGVAGDYVIKEKDIIMIDLGARYEKGNEMWCCDITRTYFVGEATEKQEEIYNIVRKAQLLSLSKVKAGVSAGEIDKTASDYIISQGYLLPHPVGHGIGKVAHEEPILYSGNEAKLKEGDVITVEPGIYLTDFGVRIEDTVLVTKDGFKYLTNYPKEVFF